MPPTNPPTKQFTPVSAYNANDPDFSLTVTIPINEQTSGGVALGSKTLVGFVVPATDGNSFSFEASADGVTWYPLWNGGSALSLGVGSGTYQTVSPAVFAGVAWLRITSNQVESAARTITLVTRPV